MKKYLRSSLYIDGEHVATMLVADSDTHMDLYQMATVIRAQDGMIGMDTDIEVFEYEGDTSAATTEAARRAESRIPKERAQEDILYYWVLANLLRTKEGGVIATASPVPLDAESIRGVFARAVQHERYKHHRLIGLDRNGEMIVFVA